MNATDHITSLNKWNSKQELRQSNMTKYRGTIKKALERSMSCELVNTKIWSSAMLFKN